MVTRDGEIGPNVTEWKLVDVPDLGYFTTDKPFPRGELLIKTKTMIDGYYKHQDVSDLLFISEAAAACVFASVILATSAVSMDAQM